MDFSSLIDTNVNIRGLISDIITDKCGVDRIILVDVYVNGVFFRDHIYMQKSKRLDVCSVGDILTATVKLRYYPNPDTNRMDKIGFKQVRNVKV